MRAGDERPYRDAAGNPFDDRDVAGTSQFPALDPATSFPYVPVLDPDEPSYLLWGPDLGRDVVFLPSLTAVQAAIRDDLSYVVVSTGVNAPVAAAFAEAGWRVDPLGSYWQLARRA